MAKQGRTRVLRASIDGQQIHVTCVGRMRRYEADFSVSSFARQDQSAVFAALTESGQVCDWHGRSVAFPLPASSTDLWRGWVAHDVSFQIESARNAGMLCLDNLVNVGDSVRGTLPFVIKLRPVDNRWTIRGPSLARSPHALRTLDSPHGMDRIAHLCPQVIPILVSETAAWANQVNLGDGIRSSLDNPEDFFDALNAIAPCRVPDALVGGDVRAAWILPSSRYFYSSVSELKHLLSYQILSISTSGAVLEPSPKLFYRAPHQWTT